MTDRARHATCYRALINYYNTLIVGLAHSVLVLEPRHHLVLPVLHTLSDASPFAKVGLHFGEVVSSTLKPVLRL